LTIKIGLGVKVWLAIQASWAGSLLLKCLPRLFKQNNVTNTNPSGDKFHQKSVSTLGSLKLRIMAPQETAESWNPTFRKERMTSPRMKMGVATAACARAKGANAGSM